MTDDTRTIVVFRMWRNATRDGSEPLALFPREEWSHGMVASYARLGQHGGADYAGCIARTRPATPEEYAPLAAELERLGYRLDIRQRAPRQTFGGGR